MAGMPGNRRAARVAVIGCLFAILTSMNVPTVAQAASQKEPVPVHSLLPAQVVLNQVPGNVPYVDGADNAKWPDIVSQSAVVMDMDTGTVVYGKNPLALHYPASITKIMTALLALKLGHLNDVLTASQNAVNQPPDKLYLEVGEQEELRPLLTAMLLDSANDVAVEIAEHYGGSVAHFAQMMNAEAKALGAQHTHFVNPSGLPNPDHTTTAYDMAVITRAAMQEPEFRTIVDTKYDNWQGRAWHARLVNLNRMLFTYPGAIGVKTGFTSVAHETLVVAARRGATTFLAVLMDCPTDAQIRADATALLNYAFAHYETQRVLPAHHVVGTVVGADGADPVATALPVLATVSLGAPMRVASKVGYAAPQAVTAADTRVGALHLVSSSGNAIGEVPLVVEKPYTPVPRPMVWPRNAAIAACVVVILTVLLYWRRKVVRRRRARAALVAKAQPWRAGWELAKRDGPR
ncbi:D-alanyl-D-alanine carboxypeptidase (penicillin-binding protein 5/6) [Alicyclobacillus sacchari]|uniref:D-alanyl-D-alanine carboxypeptidase (Penicillin-binding protein 5/6) n=2 Tax=Alicyclobacillus sacchari TaxID=392010 RepID=A0A4R8LMJ2_9BACL|nr:D-alanyl-D-alanine carboxypeptidase (penicillin-binding protein 5/6) [Alicyclobacillus sacchari]